MKLEGIKKIVVFRALQIGDMLCSMPAIRALKKAYPTAEITLVGLPWASMLTERFSHYFTNFIAFPGYPGFPEQAVNRVEFPSFLQHIQAQKFDLAIQMQGSGTISNPLVDLFAAKYISGFYQLNNYCPNKNLFIEYPSGLHEVHRHLRLMQALDIPATNVDLEFPILPKDEEDVEKSGIHLSPKSYVIIHPGARDPNRQWSPENFADVGDRCIEDGFDVVITGTKDEMDIVNKVVRHMKTMPIIAAGKTSIGAVAVLVKNAAAVVSNCTGVAHISAALKTKSIVVSLDVEPYRWAPLNHQLHTTIDWSATPNKKLVINAFEKLIGEAANEVEQQTH